MIEPPHVKQRIHENVQSQVLFPAKIPSQVISPTSNTLDLHNLQRLENISNPVIEALGRLQRLEGFYMGLQRDRDAALEEKNRLQKTVDVQLENLYPNLTCGMQHPLSLDSIRCRVFAPSATLLEAPFTPLQSSPIFLRAPLQPLLALTPSKGPLPNPNWIELKRILDTEMCHYQSSLMQMRLGSLDLENRLQEQQIHEENCQMRIAGVPDVIAGIFGDQKEAMLELKRIGLMSWQDVQVARRELFRMVDEARVNLQQGIYASRDSRSVKDLQAQLASMLAILRDEGQERIQKVLEVDQLENSHRRIAATREWNFHERPKKQVLQEARRQVPKTRSFRLGVGPTSRWEVSRSLPRKHLESMEVDWKAECDRIKSLSCKNSPIDERFKEMREIIKAEHKCSTAARTADYDQAEDRGSSLFKRAVSTSEGAKLQEVSRSSPDPVTIVPSLSRAETRGQLRLGESSKVKESKSVLLRSPKTMKDGRNSKSFSKAQRGDKSTSTSTKIDKKHQGPFRQRTLTSKNIGQETIDHTLSLKHKTPLATRRTLSKKNIGVETISAASLGRAKLSRPGMKKTPLSSISGPSPRMFQDRTLVRQPSRDGTGESYRFMSHGQTAAGVLRSPKRQNLKSMIPRSHCSEYLTQPMIFDAMKKAENYTFQDCLDEVERMQQVSQLGVIKSYPTVSRLATLCNQDDIAFQSDVTRGRALKAILKSGIYYPLQISHCNRVLDATLHLLVLDQNFSKKEKQELVRLIEAYLAISDKNLSFKTVSAISILIDYDIYVNTNVINYLLEESFEFEDVGFVVASMTVLSASRMGHRKSDQYALFVAALSRCKNTPAALSAACLGLEVFARRAMRELFSTEDKYTRNLNLVRSLLSNREEASFSMDTASWETMNSSTFMPSIKQLCRSLPIWMPYDGSDIKEVVNLLSVDDLEEETHSLAFAALACLAETSVVHLHQMFTFGNAQTIQLFIARPERTSLWIKNHSTCFSLVRILRMALNVPFARVKLWEHMNTIIHLIYDSLLLHQQEAELTAVCLEALALTPWEIMETELVPAPLHHVTADAFDATLSGANVRKWPSRPMSAAPRKDSPFLAHSIEEIRLSLLIFIMASCHQTTLHHDLAKSRVPQLILSSLASFEQATDLSQDHLLLLYSLEALITLVIVSKDFSMLSHPDNFWEIWFPSLDSQALSDLCLRLLARYSSRAEVVLVTLRLFSNVCLVTHEVNLPRIGFLRDIIECPNFMDMFELQRVVFKILKRYEAFTSEATTFINTMEPQIKASPELSLAMHQQDWRLCELTENLSLQ